MPDRIRELATPLRIFFVGWILAILVIAGACYWGSLGPKS